MCHEVNIHSFLLFSCSISISFSCLAEGFSVNFFTLLQKDADFSNINRYVEVNMNSAALVWPLFNSLQAFWPGLQVTNI